jgi:hypothetical protein
MRKCGLPIASILLLLLINDCKNSPPSGPGNGSTQVHKPLIEFTFVPNYGTTDSLKGKVGNIKPDSFEVAVYIFVEGSGWWTKPTFANPLTPIQSDSTWKCNITTGSNDLYATEICAFLLRNGVSAPQAAGLSDLPTSLDTISVASVSIVRYGRSFSFSGYEWWAKASITPVGPGPNYFSDNEENVWVDSVGQLHLCVTQSNGVWHCPEVINKSSLGYGRYIFQVTGEIGNLDKNVVLGIFTWDNSSAENHREIDMEFSQWGIEQDTNSQYVVQPYSQSGNLHHWVIPTSMDSSTHSFAWEPDSIHLLSAKGYQSALPYDSILHSWPYSGPGVPSHGNENARINLWLFNGVPPSNSMQTEVVIKKFEYIGAPTPVRNNN